MNAIAKNGVLLEFIKPGDRVTLAMVTDGVLEKLTGEVLPGEEPLGLEVLVGDTKRLISLRSSAGYWSRTVAIIDHQGRREPGSFWLANGRAVVRVRDDGFRFEYANTAEPYEPAVADGLVELIPKPTTVELDMPADLYDRLRRHLLNGGAEGQRLCVLVQDIYGASARRRVGLDGEDNDPTPAGEGWRDLTPAEQARIERDMRDPELGNGPSHGAGQPAEWPPAFARDPKRDAKGTGERS